MGICLISIYFTHAGDTARRWILTTSLIVAYEQQSQVQQLQHSHISVILN